MKKEGKNGGREEGEEKKVGVRLVLSVADKLNKVSNGLRAAGVISLYHKLSVNTARHLTCKKTVFEVLIMSRSHCKY